MTNAQIRLECIKQAVALTARPTVPASDIIKQAQAMYDWIMQREEPARDMTFQPPPRANDVGYTAKPTYGV